MRDWHSNMRTNQIPYYYRKRGRIEVGEWATRNLHLSSRAYRLRPRSFGSRYGRMRNGTWSRRHPRKERNESSVRDESGTKRLERTGTGRSYGSGV